MEKIDINVNQLLVRDYEDIELASKKPSHLELLPVIEERNINYPVAVLETSRGFVVIDREDYALCYLMLGREKIPCNVRKKELQFDSRLKTLQEELDYKNNRYESYCEWLNSPRTHKGLGINGSF